MEATFTMWPLFRSSIGGNNARARRMGASRFVRTSSSARSGLISANGPAHPSPALLTRTSTRPATAKDSAAPRSTSAGSARSATITVPLALAATSSSAARSRPSASTRAPPRASRSAVALPMPLEAPVTRLTVQPDSGSRTVVFFPEGAFGPTNNCVGIGEVLKRRGHRVVFVVEESFAGTLEARGFEEATMRLAPAPEEPEVPGQFWKDFIRDTSPEFRKPTIVQLETFLQPTWQALIDGSMYVNDRLAAIFDELAPDAIVEDNVVAFAAIPASGRPWARIASCNPCELKDDLVPPVFSGYPAGDTAGWREFWVEYDRALGPQIAGFDSWLQEHGGPVLPTTRDYLWE